MLAIPGWVALLVMARGVRQTPSQLERPPLSIIGWTVLGLIAGFVGTKIVNKQGEGLLLDIALGIAFGAEGVTGLNIYSLIVAVVRSIVVLVAYHALTGRRKT